MSVRQLEERLARCEADIDVLARALLALQALVRGGARPRVSPGGKAPSNGHSKGPAVRPRGRAAR